MKGDTLSLNCIYGDPQLIALNNRVQYIRTKQNNVRLPFTTITSSEPIEKNSSQFKRPQKFISSTLATEIVESQRVR